MTGAQLEAMAVLREGVERDPQNADLWEYLGTVALAYAWADGEVVHPDALRIAADAYGKVLEIRGEGTDPSVLSNAILANTLLGNYPTALDVADRAVHLIEDAPLPDLAAPEAAERERYRASREELLAEIHSRRAEVYGRMERFEEAAEAISEALRHDPELDNGHPRRALFKLPAGDADGVVADFRTALADGTDPDWIANALFSTGYRDHFEAGRYRRALELFRMALEVAPSPGISRQIHLFTAWSYYQLGASIDDANEEAEACQPARSALANFEQVLPHLNRAGRYQADAQATLREAVDVQLFRQQQIIRNACR